MKIEELLDELKWDTHYPYHREIAAEILFLFSALTKQVEELGEGTAILNSTVATKDRDIERLTDKLEKALDSCWAHNVFCANQECKYFEIINPDICGADMRCKDYIPFYEEQT